LQNALKESDKINSELQSESRNYEDKKVAFDNQKAVYEKLKVKSDIEPFISRVKCF